MLQKSGSEGRSHHSNGLFPLRELGSVCYTPVKLAAQAGRSGRLWIFSTQAEQALRGRRDLKTFLAYLSLKAAVSTVFQGPKSELGRPSVSTRRHALGSVYVRVSQEQVLLPLFRLLWLCLAALGMP